MPTAGVVTEVPVFMEFITAEAKPVKMHFVGTSKESILADTNNGTSFGGAIIAAHRVITEEEARTLNLDYLDVGIEAVRSGCPSFKLRTPNQ